MNISAPFIVRPIATSLLMVALTIIGAVAYVLLPVAPLPQVDFPTIQVTAQLPGASPETMASSVATALERQFAQISGLSQLTSVSGIGTTSITIQFDLSRNIDAAAQDVQAAINAAAGQLPKNLPSPPTYRKTNPSDAPVMLLAMSSDTLPLATVNNYADNIVAQQLSQVDGVALVLIAGAQKPAVRVEANPLALAGRGLSLEDVRSTIAAATLNAPKGSLSGPRQGFAIENNDQLFSADAYRPVIIAWRGGSPVRLADVATVVDGPEESRGAGTHNGKRSIILIVQRQPGANAIATVERIKAALPRLQASIPPAIDMHIVTDRTQTIRASVNDVQFTLVLTIILVVMVIFLFLRDLRATVIPSITVPLSLIGTFAVMYLLGYSLNNLSLMALTIATGFVVDDAIVMVENVTRYLEQGDTPLQAALKGSKEIGFTIVSISISLIAVFIPVLLMGGLIGRLFREFAMTVSIAILMSTIVSLTLTPMMCARLLREPGEQRHGRLYLLGESVFASMLATYETGLQWALRHRRTTLAATLGTVVLTGYLYVVIPKGFFPQQDTGFIVAVSEAAQDISFSAMIERQSRLVGILLEDPGIDGVISAVGAGGVNQTVNNGRMFINLKPRDERDASASEIIDRLRGKLAQVEGIALFMQASQDINVGGRFSRTQYQFTLQDGDLDEIDHWAPILLRALQGIPLLRDVATDQQIAGPTVRLQINRDAASRLGVATPALPARSRRARTNLRPVHHRPAGSAERPGRAQAHGTFAFGQPSEPVSRDNAVFQSGAGCRPGTGGRGDHQGQAGSQCPRYADHDIPRQCPSVPKLARNPTPADPGGADRHLHHSRHTLREPRSSDHDPLHHSVRRGRGAAHSHRLPLRAQRRCAHRHHPVDRDRQEERDHDDRLRAGRRADPGNECRGFDLSSRSAALSADHDDDLCGTSRGGTARARPWNRCRDPAAARLCHRRRAVALPVLDALHDAGDLSRPGPVPGKTRRRPATFFG
jgi:multidrug efflux pump subunit AcrB